MALGSNSDGAKNARASKRPWAAGAPKSNRAASVIVTVNRFVNVRSVSKTSTSGSEASCVLEFPPTGCPFILSGIVSTSQENTWPEPTQEIVALDRVNLGTVVSYPKLKDSGFIKLYQLVQFSEDNLQNFFQEEEEETPTDLSQTGAKSPSMKETNLDGLIPGSTAGEGVSNAPRGWITSSRVSEGRYSGGPSEGRRAEAAENLDDAKKAREEVEKAHVEAEVWDDLQKVEANATSRMGEVAEQVVSQFKVVEALKKFALKLPKYLHKQSLHWVRSYVWSRYPNFDFSRCKTIATTFFEVKEKKAKGIV
ncbi:hypothetical protein NE237_024266 [Protea cynaroides]|uniref:Uncharacterized protein n=1 Tax=Protea cynaroides TaxID=273540 RepID=A0A9Q0HDE4_9MAGN|nr:hypothetical protein NE237_024266 [Protea cynaroides]